MVQFLRIISIFNQEVSMIRKYVLVAVILFATLCILACGQENEESTNKAVEETKEAAEAISDAAQQAGSQFLQNAPKRHSRPSPGWTPKPGGTTTETEAKNG
jgi:hypothetical protein